MTFIVSYVDGEDTSYEQLWRFMEETVIRVSNVAHHYFGDLTTVFCS